MRMQHLVVIVIVLGALVRAPGGVLSAGLPGDYVKLMASELKSVEPAPELRNACSYMFTAAVLYAKQHPANPGYGNEKFLELAAKLGDVTAEQSERDDSQNRQDYEWAREFLAQHRLDEKVEAVLFSPAFGELDPRSLAEWILADGRPVRLGLQLHKFIWDPATQGV